MEPKKQNSVVLTEDGIIYASFVGDQSAETWEKAEVKIKQFMSDAFDLSQHVLLLADGSEVGNVPPEFLRMAFMSLKDEFKKYGTVIATVVKRDSFKEILNFFMHSSRFEGRFKLFSNFEEARAWLLEMN